MLIDGDNLWTSKLYHIKCGHQFYGPPVIEECVCTCQVSRVSSVMSKANVYDAVTVSL